MEREEILASAILCRKPQAASARHSQIGFLRITLCESRLCVLVHNFVQFRSEYCIEESESVLRASHNVIFLDVGGCSNATSSQSGSYWCDTAPTCVKPSVTDFTQV